MIKFVKNKTFSSLTESGQTNPIRWTILKKIDDNTYEEVSPIIKCRDYFNDWVVSINSKVDFKCYGFQTDFACYEDQVGMYVKVTGLLKAFKENICFVNKHLESINRPLIEFYAVVDDGIILWLDPFYMRSSYYISYITAMIRCANCNDVISSIDQLADKDTIGHGLKTKKLELPDGLEDFAHHSKECEWASNPLCKAAEYTDLNKDNIESVKMVIHNCGYINWKTVLPAGV